MKVVIANSIGIDSRGNHIVHFPTRWTATTGPVKPFTYYPYELAYLSTLLKRETNHDVKMVDGNLLQLDPDGYIELLEQEAPDWLIMETATLIYPDDLKVALAMKRRFGTKLVFAGPHPTALPKEVLADGVDYACIGEYETTVLDLLTGKDPASIPGLYPNSFRSLLDVNSLPFPEDDDVSRWDYIYIDGSDYAEIEFFASRGCPLSCNFCVCGNITYKGPNWRRRDVASIIEEIAYLRGRYPMMEGLFFDEEYHNVNKRFMLELTAAIKRSGFHDLKYNAMCAYMTLDRQMMEAMRDAGYYKLRIGIETASERAAAAMNMKKKVNIPKLREVLRDAKDLGLRIYGTFTVGGMGSTGEEDRKTIRLMEELLEEDWLHDLQISISTPQPGTPFFNWAHQNGYLVSYDWYDYDGSTCAVVSYPDYSKAEIEENMRLFSEVRDRTMRKRHVRRAVPSTPDRAYAPGAGQPAGTTPVRMRWG